MKHTLVREIRRWGVKIPNTPCTVYFSDIKQGSHVDSLNENRWEIEVEYDNYQSVIDNLTPGIYAATLLGLKHEYNTLLYIDPSVSDTRPTTTTIRTPVRATRFTINTSTNLCIESA